MFSQSLSSHAAEWTQKFLACTSHDTAVKTLESWYQSHAKLRGAGADFFLEHNLKGQKGFNRLKNQSEFSFLRSAMAEFRGNHPLKPPQDLAGPSASFSNSLSKDQFPPREILDAECPPEIKKACQLISNGPYRVRFSTIESIDRLGARGKAPKKDYLSREQMHEVMLTRFGGLPWEKLGRITTGRIDSVRIEKKGTECGDIYRASQTGLLVYHHANERSDPLSRTKLTLNTVAKDVISAVEYALHNGADEGVAGEKLSYCSLFSTMEKLYQFPINRWTVDDIEVLRRTGWLLGKRGFRIGESY